MSDPLFKAGFDHPCRETCSGWQQGFERGREDFAKLLDASRWMREALVTFAETYTHAKTIFIFGGKVDLKDFADEKIARKALASYDGVMKSITKGNEE